MSIVQLRIGICCHLFKEFFFFFFKRKAIFKEGRGGTLSLLLQGEEMSCGAQRQAEEWVCHNCHSQSDLSFTHGRGCVCFPISPCRAYGGDREREVQPASVAGNKIHHMSQWVLRVVLHASSVSVLGPHVPVPPPARPSQRSTGREEGCSRAVSDPTPAGRGLRGFAGEGKALRPFGKTCQCCHSWHGGIVVLYLLFSVASTPSSAALTPCPSPKLWFYG